MVEVELLEEETFKKMLLDELKNNFTEIEINKLLIFFPEEKNNLIMMIKKNKQDEV